MRNLYCAIVAIVSLMSFTSASLAQGYPGAGLFRYQCEANGITFSTPIGDWVTVNRAQLQTAMTVAITSRQNQVIAQGARISVWALSTNELQVHRNVDPDGTKMIWPSNICGPVVSVAPGQPEVVSYAQVTGPGQAVAYTRVVGQGTGIAQVTPDGNVLAVAHIAPSLAAPANDMSSGHVHVVRAGENLFRIALRYHATVAQLAAINGVSNPAQIFVGQRLYIP